MKESANERFQLKNERTNIIRYKPLCLCMNDFDVIKIKDTFHVIHLQGPPIYPFDATILETSYGHIVSKDLIKWETQVPAFGVSDISHFDDSGIWTMHIIEHENRYWMFYTGLNRRIYFQQKIGLAISQDLTLNNWKRYKKNPILSADSSYYQTDDDMAWRDPFVVFDKKSNQWLMFIAAKNKDGKKDTRGCIGLAVSEDLINWEVKPPILEPRKFFEMECPVVQFINNAYYLFVSVSNDYRVYVYKADNLLGTYEALGPITQPYNYSPRLIQNRKDEWVFLHTVWRRWKNEDQGEIMRGMLAQPKLLNFNEKGKPFLSWYPDIEKYLHESFSKKGKNGLMEISISEPITELLVYLRYVETKDEIKGTQVLLIDEFLEISYIEDDYKLSKHDLLNINEISNLKILIFNEYYEVYLDNKLISSTMGYRHHDGLFKVKMNGKEMDFSFRKFLK